jgi:tetratricopeptide (TPR) repeat protein
MFVNTYHEEAHAKLQAGEIIQSIKLYSLALESSPQNAELLSERGVAYLHLKDYENCFTDMNASLNLEPDYSYRYASRAYAKDFFGDLDGAILDYEHAIELEPDNALNHNNLGLLLEKKGYQKAAKANFDRSDRLNKLEKGYDQMLDQIEDQITEEEKEEELTTSSSETSPAPEDSKTSRTSLKEFFKLFRSKAQRTEFWNFVKNGFHIK